MKIVCISDTHNQHERLVIPPCDLLIHAGDATNQGTTKELDKFWAWLSKQHAKTKIFVPGNHDITCQTKTHRPNPSLGIDVLVDRYINVDGFNIYGSPWQPEFYNWAYNLTRNGITLEDKWTNIPNDVHILVTHGPAFGCLDDSKGCELLASRLEQLPNLRLHVFGHIHEGAGERQGRYTSVNATMAYLPVARDPVVLELFL